MLPIIIALDFQSAHHALELLNKCDPKLCRVKIGKGMFTRYGVEFVKQVQQLGFDIFLDLKFHDIPNTVYDACKAACDLGVWMINLHALGGMEMMVKAQQAVSGYQNTYLIAVTLLTSLNEAEFKSFHCSLSLSEMVFNLAKMANESGLDGVVASSHETKLIKQSFGDDFITVTPGIRLRSDELNDQKRVMTPRQALDNGADFLVIGRSITTASDPMKKLNEIQLDISTKIME